MSKSLGNAISLTDDASTVAQKVRGMYTDLNRVRADVPGRVEGNPVFIYHAAFNPDADEVHELQERYRQGRVGDVEVKRRRAVALNTFLEPIRARRAAWERQPGVVEEVLAPGSARAQREAAETLGRIEAAMGLRFGDSGQTR
jgi:tryptophanyl-tRNA synthetase